MKKIINIVTLLLVLFAFNSVRSQSCVNATIAITLDNYPTETTWNLKNSLGATIYSGGNYLTSQKGQTVSISVCIIQGQSYTFEILDSYGDGICCNYGSGSYSLKYGTQTLLSGGSFTFSKSHNFCFNCSSGPFGSSCNDGIQNGNETGVDCGGPACRPCVGNPSGPNTYVEIQLDRYPTETSWQLLNGSTIVASGSGYNVQNLWINNSVTLLQGQNYTFRILDSYGDGLCCKLGGGQGYYKIVSNGVTLVASTSFQNSAEHSFCYNCSPSYYTCSDGIQNGYETGIDCGGPNCAPCNTINNGYRKIVFTHGFAGDETTWTKMNQVHSKNFVGAISDWPNRWTDSRSTAYDESSLDAASNTAKTQISEKFSEMVGGNPTDTNGIIIAHSMGGVVVRDMDRKYDQFPLYYGPKPYGGIITFGSPHGGSPIANSIVSGAVDYYGTKTCDYLNDELAKFDQYSPLIADLNFLLLSLYTNSNVNLGTLKSACDNFLNEKLPRLVSNRGIVIDAQLGSQKMQNLYTAPNVRKIALIGIEDQPVELKYASSFQAGNSADYFQDNEDNFAQDKLNQAITLLNVNGWISFFTFNWFAIAPIDNIKLKVLNINRDIMGLTGAINLQYNFSGQCKVDAYHYGNIQSNEIKYASTAEGCDQFNYDPGIGAVYQVISTPIYNSFNLVPLPHDGLIPVYSQEAWPGATKIYMEGSNHSQMKNDSNTKTYLKEIWGGFRGLWWEIQTK